MPIARPEMKSAPIRGAIGKASDVAGGRQVLPRGVLVVPGRRPQLATRPLVPGLVQFEEPIWSIQGAPARAWDPSRSKLAAAIIKGVKNVGLCTNYSKSHSTSLSNNPSGEEAGTVVLYLGASHGYTCSFVSDIVGPKGLVFAVDIAPRVVRDLVFVSQDRPNMAPILADANHPESFCHRVCEADWLFQDIAQKDQAGIFLKNSAWFLKPGGFACLAVKARSVDVSKNPGQVYAAVRQQLEHSSLVKLSIEEFVELDPLQQDHGFFVVKKV